MQREDLEGMTVANLKVLLSELSLPVSGKKADLIERILQNQSPNTIDAVSYTHLTLPTIAGV